MSNDLILKTKLGVQYPSYTSFIKYYKETILKENKLNVLEVINSMKISKELRDYSIKEYKKKTGLQSGTSADVLIMTGPFVAVNKNDSQYKRDFCDTQYAFYRFTKTEENIYKVEHVDKVSGEGTHLLFMNCSDWWLIPQVSLYGAAFALGNICSSYNKKGLVVSIGGIEKVIIGVGAYNVNDLLRGNLPLIDEKSKKSFNVNVLDIDYVKRL